MAALPGARLCHAILTGARLNQADLFAADLPRADLPEATLAYADLDGALMEEAVLNGTDLTGTVLQDRRSLTRFDQIDRSVREMLTAHGDWVRSSGRQGARAELRGVDLAQA